MIQGGLQIKEKELILHYSSEQIISEVHFKWHENHN